MLVRSPRIQLAVLWLALAAAAVSAGPAYGFPHTVCDARPGGAGDRFRSGWNDISPEWNPPAVPVSIGLKSDDAAIIYVGTIEEGLYHSTDGGQSWAQIYYDFVEDSGPRLPRDTVSTNIMTISFDPANPCCGIVGTGMGTYYTGASGDWERHPDCGPGMGPMSCYKAVPIPDGSGIALSETAGMSGGTFWFYTWPETAWEPGVWERGNEHVIDWGGRCYGISFDAADPPVLYFGHSVVGVAWTDDMGETVTVCSDGLGDSVCVVLADPEIPGRVLASTSDGLFLDVDYECTWEPFGAGLPGDAMVTAMIHDLTDPDVLYAGTAGRGVYWSTDRGSTFSHMTDIGMEFFFTTDLAIHPLRPNYLLATCRDRFFEPGGVYEIQIGEATDVADAVSAGKSAELYANRPNPFGLGTELSFSLAARSHVNLSVYDVAGRLVTTLVDATLDGGEHAVTWNGCDPRGRAVAAGVYVYRLETDPGEGGQPRCSPAGRMVLLR